MARIILGVTGSVASIRTPALFAGLRAAGHTVRVVATESAHHFFDSRELASDPGDPLPGGPVFRDRDEWPEGRWHRDDPVLHIELRRWADLLAIAPLDANTLAKLALGLSDNFLTCIFRAWDFARPVVLAPAMNTRMWDSPVTRRHLGQILADWGTGEPVGPWSLDDAGRVFAQHCPGIALVPPGSKRLACGDVGLGAMAEVATILAAIEGRLAVVESIDRDRDPDGSHL